MPCIYDIERFIDEWSHSSKVMKPLNWLTCAEESEYMHFRKCLSLRKQSPAEDWMEFKLRSSGLKWTRQAIWGFRLFDFWCHLKGIAVEVDGPEHAAKKSYDLYRDEYNFRRSGLIVIRVDNFNEDQAARTLEFIKSCDLWDERRNRLKVKKRALTGGNRVSRADFGKKGALHKRAV